MAAQIPLYEKEMKGLDVIEPSESPWASPGPQKKIEP